MSNPIPDSSCRVFLVGAGVVGQAILKAHVDAKVSAWITDQDASCVEAAVDQLDLDGGQWQASGIQKLGQGLCGIELICLASRSAAERRTIVIESISERLDVKRTFFAGAETLFGDDAILCTNTSTLRISTLADGLSRPEQLCGMHFFMPVDQRPAVEVIAGSQTSSETVDACVDHARRINKEPLLVNDGPGFIVNRLLSPYLNEAMLLLGRDVTAEQIERGALAYGMPMSPLELIDLIGARTMFDAGRVYWQAFPRRLDPSPMLAALIKRKHLGRSHGLGFYDYVDDERSERLSAGAQVLGAEYGRQPIVMNDEEVMHVLSIPMWIEAALAVRDGIARSPEQLDLAMRGGLGYRAATGWNGFFQTLGSRRILDSIERWSTVTPSMRAPQSLVDCLQQFDPLAAIEHFAQEAPEQP